VCIVSKTLTEEELSTCNTALVAFGAGRSRAALWTLCPADEKDVTFRAGDEHPEWSYVGRPAVAGDKYCAVVCMHYPLQSDQIVLDFQRKDMCATIKNLLTVLHSAGVNPEQVRIIYFLLWARLHLQFGWR
jgi:hypothetical protein